MTEIVALVPMRHESQRVPGKNFRSLLGQPLYVHILDNLLTCSEISKIVVDTDSDVIIEGLRDRFPEVKILVRPGHLCGDEVPMNEILLYDSAEVQADFYVQTHSTNPLLRPETISRAIQTFLENYPTHDSLFSVTRIQTRLWDALGHPINHNPAILLRTQDLLPVYEENSCLYIFGRESLVKRQNRLGEHPLMFEIEATEAWDIDEEIDFLIAEFLMSLRKSDPKST